MRAAVVVSGLLAAALLALPRPDQAAGAADDSPIVLELFTSQSCSSCPAADALLGLLGASAPDLLTLSLHVDYWNRIGWRDRYSSPAFTTRQQFYADRLRQDSVYTPELVVDGAWGVVGSEPDAVAAAIAAARARHARTAHLALVAARQGNDIVVTLGPGAGQGQILLLGFDDRHVTPIASGENAGRTVIDTNVVRSLTALGDWAGRPLALRAAPIAGDHAAVLVQAQDGGILAATVVR